MKKMMMILPLFAVMTACGQKNEAPQSAKEHFAKNFPAASNVKWESEKSGFEAEFRMDGKSCSASYDKQGSFMESEMEATQADLPVSAQQFISTKLAGKKIREIVKGSDNSGAIFYEVETGKTEYVFDATGNLTKQETEKEND